MDDGLILEIHPYSALGAIKLGMAAEDVRRIIGAPYTTSRQALPADRSTDAFEVLGLHVHYDQQGATEAIEAFSPTEPIFMGRKLIGQPFERIRSWLELLDPSLSVSATSVTSFELGFGVRAPSAGGKSDAPVEAVVVFGVGYRR